MKPGAVVWIALLPCATTAIPAAAQHVMVDLPAGPLGKAADRLAHQTKASVILGDPVLWDRRVPAVRGRMTAAAAVQRLAHHAGANVVPQGMSGWLLMIRRTRQTPPNKRPIDPDKRPIDEPATDIAADIVVQASKRGIPAELFAGSVEVIATPQIGIEAGTSALVRRSTIISSTYRGSGREKLFIRGIADSSFSGRLQSVTGLYFGDVRLTYSASDPDLQLYDIASVEVLQGPQGTLYGSGSLAGIIRLNPNMPQRGRTGGSAGMALSSVAHGGLGADADAVVELPVTDNLSLRAVGYTRTEAGWIDRPVQEAGTKRDVNRTRIAGGRATMRWWAGNGWTVDGIAMIQATRARDIAYATIDAPPLTNLAPIMEPFGGDYEAAHLIVNGRLGGLSLVSATGVAGQRFRERFGNTFDLLSDGIRSNDLLTHETRLAHVGADGAGWVAGMAYFHSNGASIYRERSGSIVSSQNIAGSVSELAIFGDGHVRIAPFLLLGAGARAVQAVSTARYEVSSAPGRFTPPRRREQWLLPTASVLLEPAPHLIAYLRYQQGRRPTIPVPAGIIGTSGERFETVDGGMRWSSRHGWRATASVEHSRWRRLSLDVVESFFGFVSSNFRNWSNLSANASLNGPLSKELRLDAAVTLNRARQTGLSGERSDAIFANARLPDVAAVIARVGVDWGHTIGPALVARFNGSVRYEGASIATLGPFAVGRRQGDYIQTAMTLNLDRGADQMVISVDNLFDVRASRYLFGNIIQAGTIVTPLRPRTVRLGYRRTFGK